MQVIEIRHRDVPGFQSFARDIRRQASLCSMTPDLHFAQRIAGDDLARDVAANLQESMRAKNAGWLVNAVEVSG